MTLKQCTIVEIYSYIDIQGELQYLQGHTEIEWAGNIRNMTNTELISLVFFKTFDIVRSLYLVSHKLF